MKVLVTPYVDLTRDEAAAQVAWTLAGPEGGVVSLHEVGVKNLSRPITPAEVALLREALRDGGEPGRGRDDVGEPVGYVCRGVALSEVVDESSSDTGVVVAVTDHANLTWRSPLAGPNDDEVGPRFPGMTGVYAPEVVVERLEAQGCIIVKPGVVVGVQDHSHLNAYESDSVQVDHHLAVSSELVPIVIVAAHMGLRVAAAMTT